MDDSATEFIEKILTQWDLSSLIKVFIDNQIDEQLFLTLSSSDIKELIPQLGLRKKFSLQYQQYLLDQAVDLLPVIDNSIDEEVHATDATESVNSASSATSSNFDDGNLIEKQCYSLNATLGQPYVITKYSSGPEETVRPLLDSTEEGTIVKKSYGANSKFLRTNLCNLIIKNELQHSVDKRITTERFITLAKEINDIFIHEEAAIYYLPYCKRSNGKIVAARGKLWSTYVHQRQLYKKAGLLKTRSDSTFNQACQPSTSRANTETDESEDFDILIWLQNNAEPFNQVHTYWERTASKRLKFENAPQSESIDAYLRRYPALGRQSGYILLDSDFKYLFPGENNNIFTKWPIFSKILWGILKTKKDSYLKERINQEIGEDQTEPNSDIVEILSLKYLPLLLQPPIIKSKAKHWKPSKQELIDAFILFVNDISEVDTVIPKRADKYLTYGLTAQPIPLFMGPYENLTAYVSINKVLYKLESHLKAVDLCFKAYHALHASYPVDAEPSWMYVQKGIFEITTKFDKKFSSVDTLIADVKLILNKP